MSEYKSFYKKAGGNEGSRCRYPVRLDTYGCGCTHDCGYCYAKSLLGFRRLWHPEDPSVADIGKIRRKLDSVPPRTVLRLGGMTDCFQPAEKKHRVTYELIRELNRRKIGYLIVTKSVLVADDEYVRIYDPELAHIQVSITATDDGKALELKRRAGYRRGSLQWKSCRALASMSLSAFLRSYRNLSTSIS